MGCHLKRTLPRSKHYSFFVFSAWSEHKRLICGEVQNKITALVTLAGWSFCDVGAQCEWQTGISTVSLSEMSLVQCQPSPAPNMSAIQ